MFLGGETGERCTTEIVEEFDLLGLNLILFYPSFSLKKVVMGKIQDKMIKCGWGETEKQLKTYEEEVT